LLRADGGGGLGRAGARHAAGARGGRGPGPGRRGARRGPRGRRVHRPERAGAVGAAALLARGPGRAGAGAGRRGGRARGRPGAGARRLGPGPAGALAVLAPGGGAGSGDAGRGQAAEAYRALRLGLRQASPGRPLGALAVTSPAPAEGKTTTAANLACALAQAGARVVLVDADLRRPSLHKLFGLDNHEGLTTLLLGDAPRGPGLPLQGTPVPGLEVLTSGPIPSNPAELLGSGRLQQTLAALQAGADVVIV